MKKLIRLLALLLSFALVFSMLSCGKTADDEEDEEETRYTIREKEWVAFREMSNFTNEIKYYSEDGLFQTVILKEADGFCCLCNTVYEEGDNTNNEGASSIVAPSIFSGGDDLAPDTENPGESYNTADTGVSDDTGTIDTGDYVVDSHNHLQTGNGKTFDASEFSEDVFMGEVVISRADSSIWIENTISSIHWEIEYDPIIVGPGGGPVAALKASYMDAFGNSYTVGNVLDILFYANRCIKEYNGTIYCEIEVNDADGNTVKKWIDSKNIPSVSFGEAEEEAIEFDELVYDKAEKAYVLRQSLEEAEIKSYFYFENGKIVKSLVFYVILDEHDHDHEHKEPYDVSTLTPKSNYSSADYTTVETIYSNVGKTKIEEHTFSENDIIFPKENN